MRFCLVSEDSVPAETVALLREACRERQIPFEVLTARTFNFDPGVATFHAAKDDVYFGMNSQTLLVESAGIRIPKTVYIGQSFRA